MNRFLPFKLYKYVAKEFTAWFLGAFLLVLALIYLLEFSELLRRSQGISEATYQVILEMAFLKLPHVGEELLPFILFFSAILCLWRLNRFHEIIVMRSSGVSAWQFLMPIAVTSFLIGAVDVCVINPLSSLMKQRFDVMESKYLRKQLYSLNVSESGVWIRQVTETGATIYRIGKVDLKRSAFHDLTLYQFQGNDHFVERVDAPIGWLIENDLHLEKAWVQKAGELPQKRVNMVIPSNLTLEKLTETNISPDSMSFWELSNFIYLLEKSGLLRDEYKLYWHALIARVFWLVSMIFLAGACVLHPVRQGKIGLFIFLGVVSGFGLYVLKDVTYVMGAASTIPVIIAAWTPVVITLMTGISALLYFEDG